MVEEWEKGEGVLSAEQQIKFKIDYTLPENDPRELSEIPEIRLWFIALNARYPWFPILLNWREGELALILLWLYPTSLNGQRAYNIILRRWIFL